MLGRRPHILKLIMLSNCLIVLGLGWQWAKSAPLPQEPTPEPMIDRLAVPVLPENPTQIDLGNQVYFYHCMPCHGDRGQGLTDEFREVWVEDHRNCWKGGCHGGREKDEGFPIARHIPGVLDLPGFGTPQSLFDYLKTTHPPQDPGRLSDEEYWSVTAFVLHLGGRLSPAEQVGPKAKEQHRNSAIFVIPLVLLVIIILALAMTWQTRQTGEESGHALP
jgi:mono/diheme cytochrome c family protein